MEHTQKSTNVRTFIKAAGTRLPGLASWIATRLFFVPPRPRRDRSAELRALARVSPLDLRLDGKPLRAWRWGAGPRVLVQHGWGGSSGQMTPLAEALVEAGFTVLAVDAPGHGGSGWRSHASLVDFTRAMEVLVEREGPLFAAVGHSLGAASVAFAQVRGLGARALVLVAPFARPRQTYEGFLRMFGVGREVIAHARARIEARVGIDFDDLDLRDNLAKAEVPTWIVHDHDDRHVAFEGSREVAEAVPSVRLLPTRGLGHGRLLADARVVASIVEALHDGDLPRPWTTIRAPRPSSDWGLSPEELRADLDYGRV